MTAKKSIEEKDDQMMGFVMAAREQLMNYFKGNCIEQFADCYRYNLELRSVEQRQRGERRITNSERREYDLHRHCQLRYRNTVLLSLQHEPKMATYYPQVMARSPELTFVWNKLETFFTRYLPNVTLQPDTKTKLNRNTDASRDSEIGQRANPQDGVEQLIEHAKRRMEREQSTSTRVAMFGSPSEMVRTYVTYDPVNLTTYSQVEWNSVEVPRIAADETSPFAPF